MAGRYWTFMATAAVALGCGQGNSDERDDAGETIEDARDDGHRADLSDEFLDDSAEAPEADGDDGIAESGECVLAECEASCPHTGGPPYGFCDPERGCVCTHTDPPWDADVDADVDADAGADADAEMEDDTADDSDAGAGACDDGWFDPSSGLCWQDPPAATELSWADAMAYCDGLSLGGHPAGTWHLPTINESRSLIRGCPGTVTGGACGITDACLVGACSSGACRSCLYLRGPGAGGCYWDVALSGTCLWYWSSSSFDEGAGSYARDIDFTRGDVGGNALANAGHVRCARRVP